jgi:tetratricopeptide (TPR) repeat protein
MNPIPASLVFSAALLAALLHPTVLPAATPCDPPIAQMVSVQGNVVVRRVGQAQSQSARLNETYCPGDRIQVGEKSRADIALTNQPVLRLDQNTVITLPGLKQGQASLVQLVSGALHFFSRLPRNLEINTAFVDAGVEGTEGLIEVLADRTNITIFDGRVLAANAAGSLPVTSGQSAVAVRGQAPVLRTVVRPRDAVQWALYYPPVAYFRPADFQGPEPWRAMVQKSLDAYMTGDYQAAFEAMQGVPSDIRDPRFFAYRAQLLLGVGRVDEAGPDLERALKLNPNYSDALALQSIVAVVQNDKEKALSVAQQAVAADPKSAAALTALSYAQQANFDLEGALESLQQAVQVNPNDALAWARLSEVHLMFARLNEALEAAQKAAVLDPNLSRTQMVLGFAYLTQVHITESKEAFKKAIELDQADYLARLGLGLAKIRDGDLEQGGREIEIAASLNPNNSIVRSYLGKTYYEEKRIGLDGREYAIAKELDPKDPTPWFYDSIAKQTTNRPVEALQDMQKAIELNDNRAVYRSQLLLDSDLAARSAALGRIYSDLGFQQLALVEGWKSVNTDPTNFSAHRFLADSYSVLPRHQIARVSELLQSQLLQPINITPIQPQLAESNLFLISNQGPGTTSFLEFNPLFNRNQVTLQTSALGGEHNTVAGEGTLSGIYNKASFSFGGFHFQTDGWRTNANQRDTIGDAFVQMELSPKTSFQFEYRRRDSDHGDLVLNFYPNDFRPNLKETVETNSYRVGLRQAFTPSSILLGSFMYQRRDDTLTDRPTISFGTLSINQKFPDQKAFSGEVQHQFRSQYVNVVTGVGHFNIDQEQNLAVNINLPFPPPPFGPGPITLTTITNTSEDSKQTNLYLYSNLNLLKNVTFTLGVSGDIFKTQSNNANSLNQANPKVGITWNPFPNTTLRAAAFRTLKRMLITNQTLEPTQVAGFNQFYDDINSTKSWVYGAAVDQKFSETIFGGWEFSRRDLNIPFRQITATTDQVQRGDGIEYLARPYLFWTPHPWLALTAQYQYERFKNDNNVAFLFQDLTTQRVPLGLRFFHPSGLGALLQTTYVHQNGDLKRQATGLFQSGSDSFWVVDAAINYRLPKRYGFFTVGATNLFNQHFKYQETDLNNPTIQPTRTVFARVTLSLP